MRWWAVAVCFLAGCTLDEVPQEGLFCPCGPGWECEGGVCVPQIAEALPPGDYGNRSPSPIRFTVYEQQWVTPTGIRLHWELANFDESARYEVDIAGSADELINGTALAITQAQNPELARANLPNTDGDDFVNSTILRDLEPNTVYAVRMRAIDTAGGETCSPTLTITTMIPATAPPVEIFADELPAHLWLAACLGPAANQPAAGSAHLEREVLCPMRGVEDTSAICEVANAPLDKCWTQVSINGTSIDGSPVSATPGTFRSAFLELSVALAGDTAGFWADMGIFVPRPNSNDDHDHYTVGQITIPGGGEYHRFEIPLSAMSLFNGPAGARLTREILGDVVSGFMAGTELNHGTRILVDEIRLRY